MDPKDEQLKEDVHKKADLVTDLEEVTAEVDRLNDEVDKQARLAVDLVTTMNQQNVEYESALEEKKAEFESTLGRQKAELKEKFQAEFNTAYNERVQEVTAKYKAQVHRIRQRAWKLGWRAALKKVRVSEDDPNFRYPPMFRSSDPALSSAPGPSSEVPPGADAVTEANTLQANPEARSGADVVQTEIECNAEAAFFILSLFM